jgi:hypothetical protein
VKESFVAARRLARALGDCCRDFEVFAGVGLFRGVEVVDEEEEEEGVLVEVVEEEEEEESSKSSKKSVAVKVMGRICDRAMYLVISARGILRWAAILVISIFDLGGHIGGPV